MTPAVVSVSTFSGSRGIKLAACLPSVHTAQRSRVNPLGKVSSATGTTRTTDPTDTSNVSSPSTRGGVAFACAST